MAWHLALFHLETGDHDRVLAIYDTQVRPHPTDDFRDVANAVSLLWRFEQEGARSARAGASLRKTHDLSGRYVVNFSRKAIFGAGGGHHSADWGLSRGGGRPRLCNRREPQVRTLAGRAFASVPRHRHTGRRQQTRLASDRVEQSVQVFLQ